LGEDDVERRRRDGTGTSRRLLSWIWSTTPVSVQDGADEGDAVLRAEWSKSRARAARAEEEVELIQEEMRRTLKFLEWRAEWWRVKAHSRAVREIGLQEALRAFALQQSSLHTKLSASFRTMWTTSPRDIDENDHVFQGRFPDNDDPEPLEEDNDDLDPQHDCDDSNDSSSSSDEGHSDVLPVE
jgi:Mn-containing catalase